MFQHDLNRIERERERKEEPKKQKQNKYLKIEINTFEKRKKNE